MLQALSYFTIAALLIFEGFMITTAEPVQPRALPDIVVRLPLSRPPTTTTVLVTPPPPTSTTTTTIPYLLAQQYRYYEKGRHITALQELLGMDYIDGVYGPNTSATHIDALGGTMAAVYHFYPEIGQTPTPCSYDCLPGDGHYMLPTLGALINEYFKPEDRALARRIALCESSGLPHHIGSTEVSSALAVGWFQHLARYWQARSEKAGFKDYDPFNGRANVGVAAHLFYTSGVHHWNPSRSCWEE